MSSILGGFPLVKERHVIGFRKPPPFLLLAWCLLTLCGINYFGFLDEREQHVCTHGSNGNATQHDGFGY